MTQKSWPVLKGETLEDIVDFVKEVTRTRDDDIGDFDQLPDLYIRGRKVGKIPADADDVATEDRPGDFNYDENYGYILVETAPNTVKWARWDLSTANPWPSLTVAAEDVTYDNTASGLSADNVQDAIDEVVGLIPSGMTIRNTYSAIKTDTSSVASTTPADISGLSITLTPVSDASVFYIISHVSGGSGSNNISRNMYLVRNSTILLAGASPSRRVASSAAFMTNSMANSHVTLSVSYIDAPNTTSPVTYKIQASSNGGSYEINRAGTNDTDNANFSRTTSSIIILELL